ncbi:MAG: DUF2334 domain-containing protein [Endomicrobia bacterium]|nr:DUF2334 domain-containing protein [Endomicrobiia bacterium]
MLKYLESDYIKTIKLLCYDLIPSYSNDIEKLITQGKIKYRLLLREPSFFKKVIDKVLLKKDVNFYNVVFNEIYSLRKEVKKLIGVDKQGEIKFLLRVDDFPRWDIHTEEFFRFYEILDKHKIPFLLGVTPFVYLPSKSNDRYRELTEKEVRFLKNAINDNMIEIALHGVTHKAISSKIKSEFISLPEQEVVDKIKKALFSLKEFKIESFIPPFNSIDTNNYFVLKNFFSIICGGKETIKYLGFYISPCCLYDTLYVPSYIPIYGYAEDILKYLKKLAVYEDEIILPITLHWSWELKNNFEYVHLLVQTIKNKVLKWKELLKIFKEST